MENQAFNPTDFPVTPAIPPPDPVIPPPPPLPAKRKGIPKPLLIILALFIVILLAVVMLVFSNKSAVTNNRPAGPISPRPTPTPQRITSAVATQSAFLALDAHVASLSASLNNFILDDPQLTPPVLELPLGF